MSIETCRRRACSQHAFIDNRHMSADIFVLGNKNFHRGRFVMAQTDRQADRTADKRTDTRTEKQTHQDIFRLNISMYDVATVQIEERLGKVGDHLRRVRFTVLDGLCDGVEQISTLSSAIETSCVSHRRTISSKAYLTLPYLTLRGRRVTA